MKEIVVIDENNRISSGLPKEYKDIRVKFSHYYKYEFQYENDEVIVVANGYNGDRIYRAGLNAEQTIGSIFAEADWGEFVILDKRFDEKNGGENDSDYSDDENDDYTDFVQANGNSLEEVVGKIAKYLKSGEHYKDGRYIQ